jgi:hypothetical protein
MPPGFLVGNRRAVGPGRPPIGERAMTPAERQRKWRQDNPEQRTLVDRRAQLKLYGLTLEQYDALLAAQGGVCAICCKPSTIRLAVDHDHLTGRLRGLLCFRCNAGLGNFGDDTDALASAVAYLGKGRVQP